MLLNMNSVVVTESHNDATRKKKYHEKNIKFVKNEFSLFIYLIPLE